ncbi:MAG: hypothetical protein L6404_06910 [Candidatus Omnitrophica bacterium]|nr:hypothetical protein [Candidatus Omnitrophota bacterium]
MKGLGRLLASVGICFIGLASVTAFAVVAIAEEPAKALLENTDIEVSSDIAIYSKYIWRGFKLDGDPVMQPGIYLSGYGVDLSIWGSTDIDSDDSITTSEEVDYSVGYSHTFNDTPLTLSGGFTYYDFPASDGASREYYVGCSLDTMLSPGLTWYHDFGDEDSGGGSGDYVVLELGHSIPVGEFPVTLDLSSHVGYNNELFINGDGGDIGLGVGLTVQLTEICSLSPSVNYSSPFGDLEDSGDGNQDDEFYGGATVAFSF